MSRPTRLPPADKASDATQRLDGFGGVGEGICPLDRDDVRGGRAGERASDASGPNHADRAERKAGLHEATATCLVRENPV
jgi:hypothetical protein